MADPSPPLPVPEHMEDFPQKAAVQLQVELRLRESEERFRAMVNLTPVPFLVSRISDGQILYANPVLQNLSGTNAAEVVGQSTLAFYADPADRARVMDQFRREKSLRNIEVQVRRPDGRRVWTSVSANPIRYEDQDCVLTTMVDLTEQKLFEQTMTTLAATAGGGESRPLLQALVDQLAAALDVTCVVLAQTDSGKPPVVLVFAGRMERALVPPRLEGPFWQKTGDTLRLHHRSVRDAYGDDQLLARLHAESAGVVPLIDTQGEQIGLLGFVHDKNLPEGGWTERILRVFAGRAAAELERKRAERDLQQAEEQLRQYALRQQHLSRQLLRTQEIERRRIAHELHDEIGQALTAVQLNLTALLKHSAEPEAVQRLQDSMEIIDRVLEQAHDLSLDLRPAMLDDLGLPAAVRWYAERLARRAGLELKLEVEEFSHKVHPAVEIACFRVAQEALSNVARHAQASSVTLFLRQTPLQIELEIRDDGQGFELTLEATDRPPRLGLLGMEERVSSIGGRLRIRSEPGTGTSVRAEFPIHGQKTEASG